MDHIGADRLRRGRVSVANRRYFITVVTEGRAVGLATKPIHESILSSLRQLHTDRDIELFCATLMPDHVHIMYRLRDRLSLDRVQAKFKAATRSALKETGLSWQKNFFDHRLRENVPAEGFARYMHLNPYVKGLIPLAESWQYWIRSQNYNPEFLEHIEGGVPAEWLQTYSKLSKLIEMDMHPKVPPRP